MRKLRITSPLGYQNPSKEDISAYIKAGLLAHKELGFDGVDFYPQLLDLTPGRWEAAAQQAVADSKEIGMPLTVCHLPYVKGGFSNKTEAYMEDFGRKMIQAIEVAKVLGVETAVMHPGTYSRERRKMDSAQQFEVAKQHLTPFVEHAAKLGVNVVVENMPVKLSQLMMHRFTQEAEELITLADYFGIGVCWDIGHANTTGCDPYAAITALGSRLKQVHVHDNCATLDSHGIPFTGEVDWQRVMAGLAAVEFKGAFDLEVKPDKKPAPVRMAYGRLAVEAAEHLLTLMK